MDIVFNNCRQRFTSRSLSLIDTGNVLIGECVATRGHVYEYTKDVNKCGSLRGK